MRRTINYKIIPHNMSEWNQKYLTFSVEEGKTYFLLGDNGIGKSTLMNFFPIRQKNSHYDIEFEMKITKELLYETFKVMRVNDQELRSIITKHFKKTQLTFRYSEIRKENKHSIIDKINDDVMAVIKKTSWEMINLKKQTLKEKLQLIIDEAKKGIDQANAELDKKVTIRELIKKYQFTIKTNIFRFETYNSRIDYFKEILDFFEPRKKELETRDFLERIYFRSRMGISNKRNEIEKMIKDLKKINFEIQQIFIDEESEYNNNGKIFIRDIINRFLINFSMPIDLTKNFRYSNDDKLSKGQKALRNLEEEIKSYKFRQYQHGVLLEEPFNFLDYKHQEKAKKILYNFKATKLITTHSINDINPQDIVNCIFMFKDKKGKRCIANYFDLKNDNDVNDQTFNFINHSLIMWGVKNQRKNILLVEGYTDYKILTKLPRNFEVIPIGGAQYINMALNFYGRYVEKKHLRFLLDRDAAGKSAISNSNIDRNLNITSEIMNDNFEIESMLIGRKIRRSEKKKIFKDAMNKEKYDSKIRELISKINKQFLRK